MRLPRALPLLLLVLPLSTLLSCGVRFRDSFEGTELFKGIQLTGDRLPNAELTLKLTVSPGYPVPLDVVCYYEDDHKLTDDEKKLAFHERATRIGETVLPPATGHKPSDKLPRQTLSFRFSVPEPGDYFLACLTPAAADNGLGLAFVIKDEAGKAAGRPN